MVLLLHVLLHPLVSVHSLITALLHGIIPGLPSHTHGGHPLLYHASHIALVPPVLHSLLHHHPTMTSILTHVTHSLIHSLLIHDMSIHSSIDPSLCIHALSSLCIHPLASLLSVLLLLLHPVLLLLSTKLTVLTSMMYR